VKDRASSPPARGRSVLSDWRAWLPVEKAEIFYEVVRELESNYAMFSVALNEAIELRQSGCSPKAAQAAGISAGLCKLLTRPLAGMLHTLVEHAKHYGVLPQAAPLDPANFAGLEGQRSARRSGLLNRVLFSSRVQFFHKVNTLGEMVEALEGDYCQVAEEIYENMAINSKLAWETIDADHYDLNTCLREGIILFKSFLVAIPEDQLEIFGQRYRSQLAALVKQRRSRPVRIRHRRMAPIAGE
jgi:hypothetical protein